jgi:nucleoside-diphosphate-sugar epimerase
MKTAIITGSSGLIGSEAVRHFAAAGYDVIGLDNDMRAQFFGPEVDSPHDCRPATGVLEFPSYRRGHPRR